MNTKENHEKPYYGYRAVRYFIVALIAGGIVTIALAFIFTAWLSILCLVLGVVLLSSGVFGHLSMGWVNNPEKIELVKDNFLDRLGNVWTGNGKVLDIGTGLGHVAIEIAKRFPEAQVVGVDTWTKGWKLFGMTKAGAEKNARIEGVSGRCTFQTDSALYLPFKEGGFQLVVSSFAFHEIKVPDRTVIIKEAVRVLAPGGVFVICDSFSSPLLKTYNVKNMPELHEKVQQMGVEDVKYESLKKAGVNLGVLTHLWGIGYLSGWKV
uniref:2-methoxy-6-polyprenyl-1,4-benzoquinol methylase, mitochondrial n=1 Tax=Candidatus Methanophaga sp. ANME-1 ERB7 TaxID=2759913 RepID=A0A7G9Z9A2_9EURY|nr:2-methoxy-6-polyprenyl-1,4-benzoquinol methylase, mitochondrial [Methanosarcinales archaeon ANME-1 ERB7]